MIRPSSFFDLPIIEGDFWPESPVAADRRPEWATASSRSKAFSPPSLPEGTAPLVSLPRPPTFEGLPPPLPVPSPHPAPSSPQTNRRRAQRASTVPPTPAGGPPPAPRPDRTVPDGSPDAPVPRPVRESPPSDPASAPGSHPSENRPVSAGNPPGPSGDGEKGFSAEGRETRRPSPHRSPC